ncbi:MAG: M23 family metallopeptidase [bacterium]|nr:M23 family metallopeptidase [bacterium]
MRLFKQLIVILAIVIAQSLIVGKKIIFFILRIAWGVFAWTSKIIFRRPLLLSYKLHLRTRLHLSGLGIKIKNPLIFLLSSKSFVHIFMVGLSVLLLFVNIIEPESENDPLLPRSILASYVRGDEESLFIDDTETSLEEETGYMTPTAVKSESPLLSEEEIDQPQTGPGTVAVIPGALIKPILPITDVGVSEPHRLQTYIVKEGDTLSTIAQKFGIKIRTVLWANNLDGDRPLRIGQKLTILPVNGVLYRVRKGDTLERIARSFSADIQKISAINGIADTQILAVGNLLVLPDAVMRSTPTPTQPKTLAGRIKNIFTPEPRKGGEQKLITPAEMIWPTTATRITQYFGWRHSGVDIAGPSSNKIFAAAAGTVVISGWQQGYGKTILIDHGNGKRTRYGHASQLFVHIGDTVTQGETIAMIGSTGRSTGPHLHFEVLVQGKRTNPFSYIRR